MPVHHPPPSPPNHQPSKPHHRRAKPRLERAKPRLGRAKPRRVVTNHQARHTRRNFRHSSGGRPIRREISAGGVVARLEQESWLVALLKTEHKRGEVWVLPKGHVEPDVGETVADAAIREVQEEAGITSLSIKEQLGITRYSFQAEDALIRKTVHYFLMITSQKRLTPQVEEHLIDAQWQPIDQAINQLEYDTDKQIVAKAREKLTGQPACPADKPAPNFQHAKPHLGQTKPRQQQPHQRKSNNKPSSKHQGPSLRIHT